MTDLSQLTDDELTTELERRTKAALGVLQPVPVAVPDWTSLISICKQHVIDKWNEGWVDDDSKHYIYEAALDAVFGPDIFPRLNERSRKLGV